MRNGGELTLADHSNGSQSPVPPGQVVFRGGRPASKQIELPDGDCWISRPIVLGSNDVLRGAGERCTTIRTTDDFVGTEIVRLVGSLASDIAVSDLALRTSLPGVAAIRQASPAVLNPILRRLVIDAPYGLILDSYTQAAFIGNVKSVGPVEQLIRLAGNANVICDIDHEGPCGTSAEPIVHLHGFANGYSKGNHLRNVLVEGVGCDLKTPFMLQHLEDIVLENVWGEVNHSTGYQIDVTDCIGVVRVRQNYVRLERSRKVRVQQTREVFWEVANLNSADLTLADVFEVDATSHVTIQDLISRANRDVHGLQGGRIEVSRAHNATVATQAVPGFAPLVRAELAGGNLLVNPSFECGTWGWTITGNPEAQLVASPTGPGRAIRLAWSGDADRGVYQEVTIGDAQVGVPVTFCALVSAGAKSGSAPGCAAVYASGAGLLYRNYSQASSGAGWQVIAQTLVPTQAGTLRVGVSAYHISELSIDDCSLSVGRSATPSRSAVASLDLGGISILVASAPPDGRFPNGSICINPSVAIGQPKSWRYTDSGWVSEGVL